MNEICFEIEKIPKGWIKTSISQISEVIMGQSPPSTTYNQDGLGLPFFQGKSEFASLHPIVKKWCSVPKKIASKDDILMSVRAPVGNTNVADRECCIGRGLAAIRYNYNYKFLLYFFRLIENKLDEKGTGTTFRSISADIVKNVQLFLPPLAEQHRIVSKIEELFSSLDKGIESLKTAQQQLKVYRQAVLKYAFEGKLTNKNVNGELPKGWKKFLISDVGIVGTGATPLRSNKSYWENGTIPWITSGALNNSYVEKAKEFITQKALKETKLKIFPKHTLLVALYGEGKTRGKCSELLFESTTNQAIAGIILKSEFKKSVRFLKWFLIKNYNDIRLLSSGGVQPNLNLSIIKNTIIPFPPIEDQQLLVKEIEFRLSVCDKIEESIIQGLLQAEALRQSILKKAFEGKLVPQDPNDEPASKLLERIKAEKEKVNKDTVSQKNKRRKSLN